MGLIGYIEVTQNGDMSWSYRRPRELEWHPVTTKSWEELGNILIDEHNTKLAEMVECSHLNEVEKSQRYENHKWESIQFYCDEPYGGIVL